MDISNHDHHAADSGGKDRRAARDSRAPQRRFPLARNGNAAGGIVDGGLGVVDRNTGRRQKRRGVRSIDRPESLDERAQLYPVLGFTRNTDERDFIARKIYSMRGKHLPNAGAVAGIRVTRRNWLRIREWEISCSSERSGREGIGAGRTEAELVFGA